jgi:hypothetical protein
MKTSHEETPSAPAQTPPLPSGAHPAATTGNEAARALMHGSEGRTARLTLVSVLLGAMVGAIVAALPPTATAFATSILSSDHLLLDLQVLAMLFLVFIVWLEFSWAVLLGLTAFDLLGNFVLFLTAITVIGLALSVANISAWYAWEVAVAATVGVNFLATRFIRGIRLPWWRWALLLGYLLISAYAASAAYDLLPPWATFSVSPLLWVSLFNLLGVAELLAFLAFLRAASQLARPAQ